VILLFAALSCGAGAWLRIALGPWGELVPWVGLAWTLVFARYSRRAAFVGMAVVLGFIDGIAAPAEWTVWPAAYLVAGTIAFATRRALAVRGWLGEAATGTLAAVLARVAALPFPPAGLPGGPGPLGPIAAGAALTGVLTAILVGMSHGWTPLRMRLASVT
jgi:hypothetical protein